MSTVESVVNSEVLSTVKPDNACQPYHLLYTGLYQHRATCLFKLHWICEQDSITDPTESFFDQILSSDSLVKEDTEPAETESEYLQFLQVMRSLIAMIQLTGFGII